MNFLDIERHQVLDDLARDNLARYEHRKARRIGSDEGRGDDFASPDSMASQQRAVFELDVLDMPCRHRRGKNARRKSPSGVVLSGEVRNAGWKRLKFGSGGRSSFSDRTCLLIRRQFHVTPAVQLVIQDRRAISVSTLTRWAIVPRVIPMWIMNNTVLRDVLLI